MFEIKAPSAFHMLILHGYWFIRTGLSSDCLAYHPCSILLWHHTDFKHFDYCFNLKGLLVIWRYHFI